MSAMRRSGATSGSVMRVKVYQPPAPVHGRAQQVDQVEGRQHHQRLEHLLVEAEAHQHRPEQQPAQPPALGRASERPSGQQERQHQQAVGVVLAAHGHANRRDDQRQRGDRPGEDPESATHQRVD